MLKRLYKYITCCVRLISDTDTADMQIRTLTLGLGMYSLKLQQINIQDLLLTPE